MTLDTPMVIVVMNLTYTNAAVCPVDITDAGTLNLEPAAAYTGDG